MAEFELEHAVGGCVDKYDLPIYIIIIDKKRENNNWFFFFLLRCVRAWLVPFASTDKNCSRRIFVLL